MSLTSTLWEMRLAAKNQWRPGDNLARLGVSSEVFARLRRELAEDVRGARFGTISGAGLLLFGCRVFHSITDRAYTYETIAEALGVAALKVEQAERDAMEEGARNMFGIEIVRSKGKRRFITTMLLHSGGSWGVLDDLCAEVVRRWSWHGIDAASDEVAAEFVDGVGAGSAGHARHLMDGEEARLAVAQMLKGVACACLMIERRGWIRSTSEATLAAMREAGESPGSLLPMLGAEAASRILQKALALDAVAAEERHFEWRWQTRADRGLLPRLVLVAPKILSAADLPGLPAAAERVRLYLAGSEALADRLVYTRSGDDLRLVAGGCVLPLARPFGRRAPVFAEYRTPSGGGEVAVNDLPFPWDPLAMFNIDSGRPVSAPPAGGRVAIVCAPGTTITALPDAFEAQPALPAGLVCAVGRSPAEPAAVMGMAGGLPFEHWLAPRGTGPAIELPRSPWPDVRHNGAPCYREWPALRVDAPSAQITIIGPSGPVPARMRWGCVEPGGPTPPGRYQIESRVGDRSARSRFTLLPGAIFERASDVDRTVLRARAHVPTCTLLIGDRAETGEGGLTLGKDVSGPLDVTVLMSFGGRPLTLTWHTSATPRRADVVPHPEGEPTSDLDLSVLRGQGGLRIRGPGRMSFTVHAKDAKWPLCLTAEGERFFPFSALSIRDLKDDQSVDIKVHWADGVVQSMGRFHDPAARRPRIEIADDRLRIEVGKLLPGEPVVELVRAWEPWVEPLRLGGTVVRAEGSAALRVEVTLPGPAAPHQVAVMVGDQRLSGMALIHRDAPVEPNLDALRTSLWQGAPDSERLAERLDAPDGAEVLRGLLWCFRRYGPQWFRASESVADAISWRGILPLMDGSGDEELRDLMATFFSALRRPGELAIRHADFDRVPPPASGESWVSAMRAFAEVHAGLLLPAWRAWGPVHPDFMGEIGPFLAWMQETEGWLLPLSPADRELLQIPPPEIGSSLRPRLRGLLEIRLQLIQLQDLSDAGTLSYADERVQAWIREAVKAKVPRALRQEGVLLERVAEVEAAIVLAASTKRSGPL